MRTRRCDDGRRYIESVIALILHSFSLARGIDVTFSRVRRTAAFGGDFEKRFQTKIHVIRAHQLNVITNRCFRERLDTRTMTASSTAAAAAAAADSSPFDLPEAAVINQPDLATPRG